METRKVQQVGGGTYTVSIPISWADEHGIEAGGTAYLYTHRDGSLVVRWGEREESALSSVDADLGEIHASVVDGHRPDQSTDESGDTDGAAAARLLDAAYTAGFDRITLRAADDISPSQRESITERARTLIGVDIVEESDSHLVVQWLLDPNDISVSQSVRQLRFVAVSTYDAAMAAVARSTAESGSFADRTEAAARVTRLIERQVNRALVVFAELDRLDATRPRLFAQYRTARELEGVAGEAADIVGTVSRAGPARSGDIVAEYRAAGVAAREAIETATDAAVDGGSGATARAALIQADDALAQARRLHRTVETEEPPDAVLLTRMIESVRRTARHAEAIGEVALQGTVRRSLP